MKVAVLSIMLLLAGCGFQLQGRRAMPPALSNLHIEAADEQSDFTRALRAALQASGLRLVAVRASNGPTLRIARDELTERVLSVNARNIPTDYELTYNVEVEVHSGGQELLVQPFELSRNFSFDEHKLLAWEKEKDILSKDLARELASVVARRLSKL